MNDRIERALALLPELASQQDELGTRALLEELYHDGIDDAMARLRSAEQAARAWGVGIRAAQKHIKQLRGRGLGWEIGGAYFLTVEQIVQHPPGPVGRPKKD